MSLEGASGESEVSARAGHDAGPPDAVTVALGPRRASRRRLLSAVAGIAALVTVGAASAARSVLTDAPSLPLVAPGLAPVRVDLPTSQPRRSAAGAWTPVAPGTERSTWGTLTQAGGGALVVDGVVEGERTVVLACGPHVVSVGRAKARVVDVPCDGAVTVGAR